MQPSKLHFVQRFDDVRQVVISRIGESLVKAARRIQRLGDVADVELEELLALRQIFDELYRCAAHQVAALQPAANAQAYADVGAVCDFQRALVAFKVAEDAARHARHGVDRRIIRMDADINPGALRHGFDLLDKIFVVFPDFVFAEHAAVRQRPLKIAESDGLVGRFQIQTACCCTAAHLAPDIAAPDAVAHVGVGCVMDARFAQIGDVLQVAMRSCGRDREVPASRPTCCAADSFAGDKS